MNGVARLAKLNSSRYLAIATVAMNAPISAHGAALSF